MAEVTMGADEDRHGFLLRVGLRVAQVEEKTKAAASYRAAARAGKRRLNAENYPGGGALLWRRTTAVVVMVMTAICRLLSGKPGADKSTLRTSKCNRFLGPRCLADPAGKAADNPGNPAGQSGGPGESNCTTGHRFADPASVTQNKGSSRYTRCPAGSGESRRNEWRQARVGPSA